MQSNLMLQEEHRGCKRLKYSGMLIEQFGNGGLR
jgi:hypothetical protein